MEHPKSQEIDMELEELLCAVVEKLKSDGTNTADTYPEMSLEDYISQEPDDVAECSTVTTHSTQCIPLLSHCRLCGLPDTDMVDIFGSSATTKQILSKINLCLPIMVRETDTLPKQVCWTCIEELDRCYRFHQTVAEAEKQLLAFDRLVSSILEETECNIETVPQCDNQYEPTNYDINRKVPTVKTSDDTNDLSSPLKPCSLVLPIVETPSINNLDAKGNTESLDDPELLEKTECNIETVPQCDDQYGPTNYDINRKTETLKTSDDANDLSSLLKPCSLVLSIVETPSINNLDAKGNTESLDDREVWDSEIFEFGTTQNSGIASGIVQQSTSALEVVGTTSCSSSIANARQAMEAENKVHRAIHKRSHTGERRYECTTCKKMFTKKWHLTRHNQIHAEIRELHKCDLCPKMYKAKDALLSHYKVHTGRDLYVCDCCGMEFVTKGARIRHYRVHTGKRPFKCSMCTLSFIRAAHLRRHTATVHSDKRNYSCSMCDKSFKTSQIRRRHMLVHTDLNERRLWQCDHCNRKFMERRPLVRHVRICTNGIQENEHEMHKDRF